MSHEIKITIVYDNNPAEFSALKDDWGFAAYIEGLEQTILFDTGANPKILAKNLTALGIDANKIDVLVLSHMHSDHIGGINAVLHEGQKVFVPSNVTSALLRKIEKEKATAVVAKETTEVLLDAATTGTFSGKIPEQGLSVETKEGRILITGCAHPGIVTMVKSQIEKKKLPAIIFGGFHLRSDSRRQIEPIAKELKTLGVKRAGPCHCSGDLARTVFAEVFDKKFMSLQLGTELRFAR